MQSLDWTWVILVALFFSTSFVDGKELRHKRDINEDAESHMMGMIEDIGKLVLEFKKETALINGKVELLYNLTSSTSINQTALLSNVIAKIDNSKEASLIAKQEIMKVMNFGFYSVTQNIDRLPHDKEWIVIQRRGTPLKPAKTRQDFNRPWIEYAEGFGDYDADFWIGLEKMHQLTSAGYTQLRVDLEDWEGNTAYAQYSVFRISTATDNYRTTVGGYSGNAGDSLARNNRKQFSTADRDNDGWASGNCAQEFGPWWHSDCNYVLLNNIYSNQSTVSIWKGIHWYGFKGFEYSLKKTSMKIRRPTNETLIADESSTI